MSKTTKKRFVTKNIENGFVFPAETDKVARVTSSRGRDLFEVQDECGEVYLASMPTKFRNTVWAKRGQFVYLQPIEEGDKVKAEIQHVLDTETVLHVREHGQWPERFEEEAQKLSRTARRGAIGPTIDPDMLPPSESEEESSCEGESDVEEEAESEEDEPNNQASTFNPNRAAAPLH